MLLAVMLLAGAGSSLAFEANGLYYDVIDANARTVKVSGFNNSYSFSSIVDVPSTVLYEGMNFTVVEIGQYAFHDFTVEEIKLPNTIYRISDWAFLGAWLKKIVIPASVREFCSFVFQSCRYLESIEFKNQIEIIPGYTFDYCTSLTTIEIPSSVKMIEPYAFRGCSNLTTVKFLSQDELWVVWNAFAECGKIRTIISYARQPNIDDNGEGAFSGDCKLFATVYVPESVVDTYKSSSTWAGFLNIKAMDISSVGGHVIDVPAISSDEKNISGTITINGQAANSQFGQVFVIVPNTDVEVGFIPNSDQAWELKTASVNGTDVTNNLIDGKYTIKNISGNQLVQATWKQGETHRLSFDWFDSEVGTVYVNGNQIQGGTYNYGHNKDINLVIQPIDGYGINSLLINQKDMKSQLTANNDGTYSYSFKLETNTRISINFGKKWNLTTTFNDGGTVAIAGENVANGTIKEVYGSFNVVISANRGYEISSIIYNGKEQLENSTYSIQYYNLWTNDGNGTNQTLSVTFQRAQSIVSVNYNEFGKVIINGNNIANGENLTFAPETDVTLAFIPNDGYMVARAFLNDEDITDQVQSGTYIINSAEGNYYFYIEFAPKPIYLTINDSEGSVGILVQSGSQQTLKFKAANDWEINSVTFNGDDVTDQLGADGEFNTPILTGETTIYVTYISSSMGVREFSAAKFSVRASKGQVMVSGVKNGEEISVFNVDGKMVTRMNAQSDNTIIPLPEHQTYIITVGRQTAKVRL